MTMLARPPVPKWVPLAGRRPAVRPFLAQAPASRNDIAVSLGLVAAGAGAAFILRPELPKGWPQTAALVGGGLLAFMGIVNFLAGRAEAVSTVPQGPAPAPSAPGRAALDYIVALDPLQGRWGLRRNMLETQNYDFTIRNNTPRPVTLWAGLAIYDDEQNLVFKSDPKVAGPIGRIEMRVPAQDTAYGRLTAPSIKFWFPQTVSVEVEIFRNQFDMQIFLRSDALPVLMSYTG